MLKQSINVEFSYIIFLITLVCRYTLKMGFENELLKKLKYKIL